jgi:hypothetical protein
MPVNASAEFVCEKKYFGRFASDRFTLCSSHLSMFAD